MKKLAKVLPLFISLVSLASCDGGNHMHKFGSIYPEINPTCTEAGRKSFYYCEECGKYFDLNKNEITDLSIPASGHRFVLSSDGYTYNCRTCNSSVASGKTKIEANKTTSIYLGSSIVNGYNGQTGDHYSFADMMECDYLFVDMTLNGEEKTVYLRKTKSYLENNDGFAGEYGFEDYKVTFNGDGIGKYNGEQFAYKIENGALVSLFPVKKLTKFNARYIKGDKSYKIAQDGYTLSDVQPRYYQHMKVGDRHSYIGLFEQALIDHKDEDISNFVIQLSTNDAGQFIDEECTKHLPFGSVLENSIKNSSMFDKNTSLGALEYMIAKAIETWNCKVSVFVCHMDTATFSTYKSNNFDITKIKTNYADLYDGAKAIKEKWGCNFIDFWDNEEINSKLNSNIGKYFSDSLHLQSDGYEATYYPVFRELFKASNTGTYEQLTYTLKVDGKDYKTINFDTNTTELTLPEIPFKKGYKIVGWDLEKIVYESKVVNAIYEKE